MYCDANIKFERNVASSQELEYQLVNSENTLPEIKIEKQRGIFDFKRGILIDFANKYIGGGVVGSGCVQEEIYFSVAPENLVSRLFCEVMDDHESIYIIGADIFCNYKGY